jgi:hypothetical protein
VSVDCGWCCKQVSPNAPRWRLHSSESSRFSGQTLLTLHPACGEEWLETIPFLPDMQEAQTEEELAT